MLADCHLGLRAQEDHARRPVPEGPQPLRSHLMEPVQDPSVPLPAPPLLQPPLPHHPLRPERPPPSPLRPPAAPLQEQDLLPERSARRRAPLSRAATHHQEHQGVLAGAVPAQEGRQPWGDERGGWGAGGETEVQAEAEGQKRFDALGVPEK